MASISCSENSADRIIAVGTVILGWIISQTLKLCKKTLQQTFFRLLQFAGTQFDYIRLVDEWVK